MKVYLARHAESEWNKDFRIQGNLDSELTRAGENQAHKLAGFFASVAPEIIYSSSVGRAQKTAKIIASANNIQLIECQLLEEQNCGPLEGCSLHQLKYHNQDLYNLLVGSHPQQRLPHGESVHDAGMRLVQFIEQLVADGKYKTVAGITHGNSLMGLVWHLLGHSEDDASRYNHPNVSVTELNVVGDKISVNGWANLTHLF